MLGFFRRRLNASTPPPELSLLSALVQDLAAKIAQPERASHVLERAAAFQRSSSADQIKDLPRLYLLFEDHLTAVDQPPRFNRAQLRDHVRSHYQPLWAFSNFALLFEPETRQQIHLAARLLQSVLQRAYPILGSAADNLLTATSDWLGHLPEQTTSPLLSALGDLPQKEADWIPWLAQFAQTIDQRLQKSLGKPTVDRIFEAAYQDLAASFMPLETFSTVINLLPSNVLDESKISLLSRNQIQRILMDKLTNLQEMNMQVQTANRQLAETIEELRKADAARTEFVSMVSHELRTPLTVILGTAKMMEEHSESLDPVTFRRLLALMVADSTRLARLVEDILDLSKIQRQGVSLQYARIDALAVAQHVVEGLRLAHPDKVFVLSIDEGFRSLVTDRDRIQQILLNLLGNAAKYTPQNGQITLEGRLQEENYTLRVIDSGPGIPEDQQRKIFDAFYRTQDAINFKAPGTGLGLTITQAIVRAMGGDISVANATPHGAIFTICLPQKLAA